MPKKPKVLKGILNLHSETGTEGGYWAFQEGRYIRKNIPRGYCKNCGRSLKEQDGAIQVAQIYTINKELLEELKRTGKLPEIPECPDGKHEEEIADSWDYKGLHVLNDGDQLTIYSLEDPTKIVWSGVIRHRVHPLFTKSVFGFWIHTDQIGVSRKRWATWFFKNNPATLIKNPEEPRIR